MTKFNFRIIGLFLIVMLTISIVSGCNTLEAGNNSSNLQTQAQDNNSNNISTNSDTLISKEPITLTYFIGLGEKASQIIKSNEEIEVYPEIEKKTGIKIKWLHPPATQVMEQLNLIIASQDLPDMIFITWSQYPGGPAAALKNKVIISLNEYIDKYAPNFKQILENNEVNKQSRLDDGTLYMFPVIRDDPSVRVWFGPQIRKDWLDRLNLNVPGTINEWYEVLKQFKEKDANGNGDVNDEIPFVSSGLGGVLNFTGAWGFVRLDFYRDGDKIKYGPIEDGFKDYIATMQKWYNEGLIDPDFAATDGNGFTAKVTNDIGGSYFGSLAGNLGRFSQILKEKNPNAMLVGTPWPSGSAGKNYQTESQHIRAIIGSGAAITTKNKYVVESVKWLDYHYSKEGHMYMNFGIEGVSYEMIDGYPKYTDLIFKNPDGLSYDVALAKYCLAPNTAEVMRDDPRKFEQFSLGTDYQKEANKLWGSGDTSLLIPPISPTPDESSELAKIQNEINTYTNEMFVKFVMNQEPIENFDKFVSDLKKMKVERAIEIIQAAYDRYQKR